MRLPNPTKRKDSYGCISNFFNIFKEWPRKMIFNLVCLFVLNVSEKWECNTVFIKTEFKGKLD